MQKGNSKKVDLLEHFKPVFQKIKDTKFFEEFFTSNIQQIKRKNEEVLDKLSDKFVTCIALIQNQYDLEDSAFSNVLSIVETVFSNTKRKIGYILLLKPILQYLINIVEIQKKEEQDREGKGKMFKKEEEKMMNDLDALLEKNFSNAKSTPYLIEIVEMYNQDNKDKEQINNFWIQSFLEGYDKIFKQISTFYKIDNIDILSLPNKIEKIKQLKQKH